MENTMSRSEEANSSKKLSFQWKKPGGAGAGSSAASISTRTCDGPDRTRGPISRKFCAQAPKSDSARAHVDDDYLLQAGDGADRSTHQKSASPSVQHHQLGATELKINRIKEPTAQGTGSNGGAAAVNVFQKALQDIVGKAPEDVGELRHDETTKEVISRARPEQDGNACRLRMLSLGILETDRFFQKHGRGSADSCCSVDPQHEQDERLSAAIAQEIDAVTAELQRLRQAASRLSLVVKKQSNVKESQSATHFSLSKKTKPQPLPLTLPSEDPCVDNKSADDESNKNRIPLVQHHRYNSAGTTTTTAYDFYPLAYRNDDSLSFFTPVERGKITKNVRGPEQDVHQAQQEEPVVPKGNTCKSSSSYSSILIVDTNQLLHNLSAVDQIAKLGRSCLIVPNRVVDELEWISKTPSEVELETGAGPTATAAGREQEEEDDGKVLRITTKADQGEVDDGKLRVKRRARDAARYLQSCGPFPGLDSSSSAYNSGVSSHKNIFLQKPEHRARVFAKEKGRRLNNDDEILACAVYFAEAFSRRTSQVLLVTEDKVLRAKSASHSVRCANIGELLTRDLEDAATTPADMARVITAEVLAARNAALENTSSKGGKGKSQRAKSKGKNYGAKSVGDNCPDPHKGMKKTGEG